jgi:uncharacterized membrane protein
MQKYLIGFLFLIGFTSHADVIHCNFTEPFFETLYDMSASTLTYKLGSAEKDKVFEKVSFEIKASGIFELVNQNGQVLQTLTLNQSGSDGMSERIYPYSVKDTNPEASLTGNQGGCVSNHLNLVTHTSAPQLD